MNQSRRPLAFGLLAPMFGVLIVTHPARLWMVFVLAVALGTVKSVDQSTCQRFVPETACGTR
jgi:hypothetical protein